jgi:hypothetical protein
MSKTDNLLKSMKPRPEIKTPIATDMFIPNHSGIKEDINAKNAFLRLDCSNAPLTGDLTLKDTDSSANQAVITRADTDNKFFIKNSVLCKTYDANTKVMLHMNGIDGSTTFTDDIGKLWTAAANAQIDTAQKKFGTASGLFDGIIDAISTPDHADFFFGTGNFTIDFWIRFNSVAANTGIFEQGADGNNYLACWWQPGNSKIYVGSAILGAWSILVNADWTPVVDTWYHVAIVRQGLNANELTFYIDGSDISSALVAGAWNGAFHNQTGNFNLCLCSNIAVPSLNGWMDEFRLSNVARWTSNFTPETSEYSAATSVVTSEVVSSEDGIATGDEGVHKFGAAAGKTYIRGSSVIIDVGASGTFTTTDGKTITVTNGVVTSIV